MDIGFYNGATHDYKMSVYGELAKVFDEIQGKDYSALGVALYVAKVTKSVVRQEKSGTFTFFNVGV